MDRSSEGLSTEELSVLQHLAPIFPQLKDDVLKISVRHASNKTEPYQKELHLQRCIDDLLEMRTYSAMASSVIIDSDDDLESDMLHIAQQVEIGSSSGDSVISLGSEPHKHRVARNSSSSSNASSFSEKIDSLSTSTPHKLTGQRPSHLGTSGTASGQKGSLPKSPEYTHKNGVPNPSQIHSKSANKRNADNRSSSERGPVHPANLNTSQPSSTPGRSHTAHTIPVLITRPGASTAMHDAPRSVLIDQTDRPNHVRYGQTTPTAHTVSRTPGPATGEGAVLSEITTKMNTVRENKKNAAMSAPASTTKTGLQISPPRIVKKNLDPAFGSAPVMPIPFPGFDPARVLNFPLSPVFKTATSLNISPPASKPAPVIHVPDADIVSVDDGLSKMVEDVTNCFPDVDKDYIREKLKKLPSFNAVTIVCNDLLENPNFPRANKDSRSPVGGSVTQPQETSPSPVNYYEQFSGSVSGIYRQQCIMLLQNDFKKVSLVDLRYLNAKFNHHYAPTRQCLMDGLKKAGISLCYRKSRNDMTMTYDTAPPDNLVSIPVDNGIEKSTRKIKLLKCGRNNVKMLAFSCMDPLLQNEIQFIISQSKIEKEEKDRILAMKLNEDEYEETGQMIECGCCFGDFMFEAMVQCYEGHLFCKECLQNYAKEAVFGSGHANLQCMTDGCDASFPMSQLKISLPSTTLNQYEERQKEEAINLADMADLVRCPHCDFAALLDPSEKVFACQNTSCMKETCRHCKEDWTDHFGIPCEELEKKDETKLRVQYEEKMTLAKIRSCLRCKTSFTKLDGCNKMTCRCGAKMCYICRKPNIDYNHFCQHVREPGKPCSKCKACSLWTNPDEDDERAVREIQNAASEARKAQGYTDDKIIGVAESLKEPPAKKPRMQ